MNSEAFFERAAPVARALGLPPSTLDTLRRHAERAYPEECCGILACSNETWIVEPCRNIQNQLHARAPLEFPRDARTAYTLDPLDFLRVNRRIESAGGRIIGFYHSHPDEPACFSAEDRARATAEEWGGPLFPEVCYLVIAVRQGRAADLKAYAWDARREDFSEIAEG